jgi:hypothetical protein
LINIKDFLGLGYYSSNLDEFLADFDRTHHKMSASQRKEIEKYRRVFALRDHALNTPMTEIFWEKF